MAKRNGNAIKFKGWRRKDNGQIVDRDPVSKRPFAQHEANKLKAALGYGGKLVPQYDR